MLYIHSCAWDTGPEFNKTMCWCNIRFVSTTQYYISTSKIYNSINQQRFEECWVKLGIQHEKQNLENKTAYINAHMLSKKHHLQDLLNEYLQVEIDRRMVDFIVGLDSEMQQLVDARSKINGWKQRRLNCAVVFLGGITGLLYTLYFYKNLQDHSRSFCRERRLVGVIIIVMNSSCLKGDRRFGKITHYYTVFQ